MNGHYNIEPSEDGLTYSFLTKSNIKYLLALTTYHIGGVKAFSLSLYPENITNLPIAFDYRIKDTVIQIIEKILKEEENTIFYVCDIEDNKEDQRKIVFEYWYTKSAYLHSYIKKYNHSIKSENGYTINASILYNVNNPLAEYIISKFKEEMAIF